MDKKICSRVLLRAHYGNDIYEKMGNGNVVVCVMRDILHVVNKPC